MPSLRRRSTTEEKKPTKSRVTEMPRRRCLCLSRFRHSAKVATTVCRFASQTITGIEPDRYAYDRSRYKIVGQMDQQRVRGHRSICCLIYRGRNESELLSFLIKSLSLSLNPILVEQFRGTGNKYHNNCQVVSRARARGTRGSLAILFLALTHSRGSNDLSSRIVELAE